MISIKGSKIKQRPQCEDSYWASENTIMKYIYQLFIDFEKAYDSIERESLYHIIIEFGIPKTLVRIIKACLDGTQSKVGIKTYLSSSFPIENGLKQGDSLSPLLFNFPNNVLLTNIT